jgi:O-antigen ligase
MSVEVSRPGSATRPIERPAVVPKVRAHTDTYRLGRAYIVVLGATALDIPNFLDRGNFLRYLLILVPIASFILIRLRAPSSLVRRPAPTDLVLLVLWGFGLTGALIGALVLHVPATTLSVFVPMSLAFLYLGTVQPLADEEVRALLRGLAYVGSAYIGLNALVNAGVVPGIDANQYRNASLTLTALGFGATIVLRRWVWVAVLLALQAFVFWTYPSGTSVLVFIAFMLTFSVTHPRPWDLRPYVIAAVLALTALLVVMNFGTTVSVADRYFALVGKNNANSSRLQAWANGLDEFRDSPLIGKAFTEAGITTVTRPGGRGEFQIPFHNDYVLFLAKGGVVGLGLLLTLIATTTVTGVRRYWMLLAADHPERAALLRVLLIGFITFFVTSAFNPSITGQSRSASLFSVYALMMSVGPKALRRSP